MRLAVPAMTVICGGIVAALVVFGQSRGASLPSDVNAYVGAVWSQDASPESTGAYVPAGVSMAEVAEAAKRREQILFEARARNAAKAAAPAWRPRMPKKDIQKKTSMVRRTRPNESVFERSRSFRTSGSVYPLRNTDARAQRLRRSRRPVIIRRR